MSLPELVKELFLESVYFGKYLAKKAAKYLSSDYNNGRSYSIIDYLKDINGDNLGSDVIKYVQKPNRRYLGPLACCVIYPVLAGGCAVLGYYATHQEDVNTLLENLIK